MHRAMASADSVVVFNEVQYHPAAEGVEWIELRNLMGVRVDLSGWKLAGGIELLFEEGTVMDSHGLLLVAADPQHADLKGQNVHPRAFTGRLNNGGESIRLENNSGRRARRVGGMRTRAVQRRQARGRRSARWARPRRHRGCR